MNYDDQIEMSSKDLARLPRAAPRGIKLESRSGRWGIVVAWDGLTIGGPGWYVGAGVRWPWEPPSRYALPDGCTMEIRRLGWVWAMWGRRPSVRR